jgi:multiple antibiotic resistance protein
LTAIVLSASGHLHERIGRRGARALEKLSGMMLIMMAMQLFLDGLQDYFAL